MKVKRFNNLWAMGLILFGVILVAFYVAKIFFPQFIVGVAEIPAIVKFGEYVDSHWFARNVFDIITTCFFGYILFSACCRTYKLNAKCFGILFVYSIALRIIGNFLQEYYNALNFVLMIVVPYLMCLVNKKLSKETFSSTIICIAVDTISQYMSLFIRDITLIANTLNTATFFVLLIDAVIWRVLLYCYFNYKKENKNG